MKALGKLKKEVGIWIYDAPLPEMGPNDLLIKIRKASICGTDLHIYKWDSWAQKTIPVPMTIGHECVGIIEKTGSAVKAFQPGDRVASEGHITCDVCRNCRAGNRHLCRNTLGVGVNRTGCFAEYLVIPQENAFLIPEEISDDLASIFDPLGNAVHTALSFNLVGEDVLITGAGPIGIMAAAIARHAGARHVVITDVNDYRLALAQKVNPTRTVNPQKTHLKEVMEELQITEGFGIGLEMSGSGQAFGDMIEALSHGGKIALLGIVPDNEGINWTDIIFKSITIKGIYGREMFETWYKMVSMIQSGLDVSSVITHRFKFEDFQKGFDSMLSGEAGKVVLDFTS